MAKRTITIDDYSGEHLTGPVNPTVLTYKGREYSLDLGPTSVQLLDEALRPFIAVAAAKPARHLVAPEDIREWARRQGMAVKDHGRLSDGVVDAYNAAHGEPE
ncbi:histone-like nucleoid-structuring protein Lsr2 [Frigoribacterium sp. R86507]|uniref:Lsr2 family DNA-binding protein n=1 Tax=Frigoribacterium sp. R86507 TaxID=3093850 RepID=UPI0037C96734